MPEGWAWCRLGTLSETTDYIANGSFADTRANVKFYKEKNYALLVKTQDFNNNFTDDLTYTDETGYNFLSKSHLFGGELLLSNIGASIGKALIVPKFDIPMAVAPNSIVVRTTDLLETQFLKSIMLSTYGQNALVAFTAGSAMPKFNKTQLRSLLIPLPTIYAQQSIISTVNTIFETIQVIENDKDELENLIKHTKSKILDLAIHGKLVPQDPNDEPAEELLKRIATSDNRPYEKVESSEIDWTLPNNWCLCHFGDISTVINGKNQSKVENPNGQYPIYGSGGIIGRADDFICPENCTIIGRKGSINNPIFVEEKFWNVDTAFGLCPSEAILPKFLFYFCEYFDFTTLDSSTTLPSLTKTNIQQIILTLPPIEEQKRILDKTFELFGKLDEIVLNLL